MDTMHLIPTSDPATESTVMDLPSDETLIAWFEEAGLHIEVAATCGDASCPECVRRAPARAA
jgi:hypothetical protein